MQLKQYWTWIFSGFCLLALALPLGAEESPYEKEIYEWDGDDGRFLVLVPPSRLRAALLGADGESPETLGVPMDRWDVFVEELTHSQKSGKNRCSVSSASSDLYGFADPRDPWKAPEPGSRTALGPIQGQPTVVVGDVEAEFSSWNFFGSVTTLIFLRIEEILKDETASLSIGDLVTVALPWGDLEVGPYRLCSHEPEGTLKFELGDTFIVTGSVDEWNDNHILTSDGFYFELIEGVVTYPPRRVSFKADPNLTLSRVRIELQGGDSDGVGENP